MRLLPQGNVLSPVQMARLNLQRKGSPHQAEIALGNSSNRDFGAVIHHSVE